MTYQNSINNTLYTQANTPICGGTSDSGPVQSANGYGNSNWVLTDQGFGNLPAFAPSPAIISTNVQVFSPAGVYTYTPSTGVQFCLIEVIGGGGGGGDSGQSPNNHGNNMSKGDQDRANAEKGSESDDSEEPEPEQKFAYQSSSSSRAGKYYR